MVNSHWGHKLSPSAAGKQKLPLAILTFPLTEKLFFLQKFYVKGGHIHCFSPPANIPPIPRDAAEAEMQESLCN